MFELQQEVQVLKRTVQRLETTISSLVKKDEEEPPSRKMLQLPSQIHPLGGIPPNRSAPLQLNASLLSAPTRSAPQNMALLSADTTNNPTGSSAARPSLSSSFKSSTGVNMSKPPTPMILTGPNSSFQGSSGVIISMPPTPTGSSAARLPSSSGFQKAITYSHKHRC